MDNPAMRPIFQNAWVVDDLEAACMQWVKQLGVGPFFVTEYTNQFEQVEYRGQPAELSMTVALAQAGDVQVELIEPKVATCAYRDSVPSGTVGFHHMCAWSDDVAQDAAYFESLGYATANRARVGPVEFAYFDTRPLLGCMLEVVTKNDAIVERFAQIAEASLGWDGSNPLR